MENPYQTPREAPPAPPPAPEEEPAGPLHARYEVDAKLRQQIIRFDVWRRWTLRRLLFPLSIVALLVLIGGLMLSLPRWLTFGGGLLFATAHTLQILLPILWTYRALRRIERGEEDPCPLGIYEIVVDDLCLSCRVDDRTEDWPLETLQGAYYLGDMLVIAPHPKRLIPIPQPADFNTASFADFCRQFAAHYQAQSDSA